MAIIKKFRITTFKKQINKILLKNISLSYNKRQVREDISLNFREGEICGLLGPNGVGKSTLFNIIVGLIKPDYGNISINGRNVTNIPIYERALNFKLSIVPQSGGVFSELTCINNLIAVVQVTLKEKNLDFWFKPHPNESFLEYYENIEKRDNLYLFDTYDDPNILIKNSDIVIAAMSKLEINAFVLGKPIIYAGTGWFWSQDYSKDCLNKDQIVNSIYEILENKPTSAEVDSFYAAIGMYEKRYINFYD